MSVWQSTVVPPKKRSVKRKLNEFDPTKSITFCVGKKSYLGSGSRSDLQRVDGFEIAAEHGFAGPAEPAFEQRCVNLAEVCVKFDVAIFKFIKARVFPDQPCPDPRTR